MIFLVKYDYVNPIKITKQVQLIIILIVRSKMIIQMIIVEYV